MNISGVLYSKIIGDTAVFSEISNRLYPNNLPQDDIAFEVSSFDPQAVYWVKTVVWAECNSHQILKHDVRVLVFAVVKDDAIRIAEKIKTALDGWNDTVIHSSKFVAESDDFDEIMRVPYQVLDFEIISN